MNDELLQFTHNALAKNIARADIADALAKAGWDSVNIHSALNAFAEVDFPLPVPRPKPYLSAKEVFIYIIMFSALFNTCYNTGSLIFNWIDKIFPDSLDYANNITLLSFFDSIRWSIANLAVSFPLFCFTFHITNKAIRENPIRRNSRPRKWLTYISLLIATLSLTCDFGTLIYNALNGELTMRFALKVLTVAIIAGGTFAYFMHDMRKEEKV